MNELEIFNSAFFIFSESFDVITTDAPFSDRIFAMANPIPLLPPVIRATLPVNFNSLKIQFRNL